MPPSALSEIDADGSFLRVNEAICDLTGYSRDELLACKLFAHTHPDDRRSSTAEPLSHAR